MATQCAVESALSVGLFRISGPLARGWSLARRVLLVGAVVAVSVGCGAPTPAAPQARPQLTLLCATGTPPAVLVLAADRGFYKAEGIDVDVRAFTSGAEAAESFKAGVGDLISAGEVPSMKLWTAFDDMMGISQVMRETDNIIIEAGPTVKSASDLKGKRIATATGSTMEYLLLRYLKQNNLRPEDVTILNMSGGADMVASLAKGDIDAFSHIQPSGWQAEEVAKGAHLLTTGKGLTWDLLVLTTRRSWLEKNRDAVKRFLIAVDKANKWAMAPENSDQVSELIAKQIKVAPAITKRILAATTYDVTVDQELKDHLNNVADFLIERKVMPRPIDWSKDFDTSLLKSIDPALVKLK